MKTKTVTVDLESYSQPCVLGNVTGGIPVGQMSIYSAGRQTGKSVYSQLAKMALNSQFGSIRFPDTDSIFNKNLCKEIMLPMITKPKSKSNYQFSRKNWHWVEINSMADDYYERLAWCEEMFGAQPKNPDAWSRWYASWGNLKFRDEADYVMYQLRWA